MAAPFPDSGFGLRFNFFFFPKDKNDNILWPHFLKQPFLLK